MQKDIFDRIISFLLGVSWAIIVFGALIIFKLFYQMDLFLSIFLTILYIVITLFLVLTLDAFSINRKRLTEAKKQTEILERIVEGQK